MDALTILSDEFQGWTSENDLPEEGDALELTFIPTLTPSQRSWLLNFIDRWNAAQTFAEAR